MEASEIGPYHLWRSGPYQAAVAYMAIGVGANRVTLALVIPFTANGSARWEAQLSTGPSPVAMACT